jgi:hypothetical protein
MLKAKMVTKGGDEEFNELLIHEGDLPNVKYWRKFQANVEVPAEFDTVSNTFLTTA